MNQMRDCLTYPRIFLLVILGIVLLFLIVILIESTQSPVVKDDDKVLPSHTSTKGVKEQFRFGPDVHFGIVLDCGSSGSRVYVYFWPPHSGNPQDLLQIQQLKDKDGNYVVKKISPGLDTFENNPGAASDYIKPLLVFAASHIPTEHHKTTLLYILATAGMRMIPEKAQDTILKDLQNDIPKEFDFVISEKNFEVISGKQEGVYAWIAVNYVLDKFGHGEDEHPLVAVDGPGDDVVKKTPHIRRRTVGMIDMGGGSMQIAYEITSATRVEEIPKHLLAEFNLGCQKTDTDHIYRVYVTTFLGYGANAARERYEELLLKTKVPLKPKTLKNQTKMFKPNEIMDPCLPVDMILEPVEPQKHDAKPIVFHGTGDYHSCQAALSPLLNLTTPCSLHPCSLNGIHQPYINFHNSEFYGFSEYWYTMEDILRIGGLYKYDDFDHHARDFCANKWSTIKTWHEKKLYPKADTNRMKMQCFKSAWITMVLHQGLKFPETYRNFQSVQYINRKDVQWTLGALIHRTRYLPLRDMEKFGPHHLKSTLFRSSFLIYNQYLLLICIIIVVLAICLYVRRLRLCPKSTTDLSRVPSMSYFMTEEDQVEQGVRSLKGYSYPYS